MPDEPKKRWYKSVPGVVTGATGFIAAVSGLLAGLNQIGVFKHDSTVTPPSTLAAPVAARSTADSTPAAAPQAKAPTLKPEPARPSRPATPTAAPGPAPAPAKPAARVELAKGTHIDLTVPARACASGSARQRVFALVAIPVKADGSTLLPAGAAAVLRLRRGDSDNHPELVLDSLGDADVSSASVRIRRGADGKACLRPDARLLATLGAPLTLRSR